MAVAASSLVALGGTVTTFAVSFLLLVIGVGNLTIAGHAWIGHRVPFAGRGRAIGTFEMSWAVALLVGAPIVALLIRLAGWRGPYVALAIATLAATAVVQRAVAPTGAAAATRHRDDGPLPATAWRVLLGSAAIAATGLGIFVVSGTWLDDRYGVSTGGLGVIAAAFGAIELMSSTTVALAGDRIGTRRTTMVGLVGVLAGLATMTTAGSSRALAVAGLLVFLAGFELAFVSSLTLLTEAAPAARGKAIGIGNAIGTVARATSVATSGQLYEHFGIRGSVVLSGAAACVALGLIAPTAVPARRRAG
jgi:predicted MFS family arabinose efflux permease